MSTPKQTFAEAKQRIADLEAALAISQADVVALTDKLRALEAQAGTTPSAAWELGFRAATVWDGEAEPPPNPF